MIGRASCLVVLIAGCWTKHTSSPELASGSVRPAPSDAAPLDAPALATSAADAKPPGPVSVELRVTPSTFTMADRAQVVYGYTVTNVSDAPIDPQLRLAELTIDGKVSVLFTNSNGNGGFDPAHRMLSPGEKRDRDLHLGPAVFKAPGDYTLVLTVLGVSSESVHVHVVGSPSTRSR